MGGWPTKEGSAVAGCDPTTLAKLAISSGAMAADYDPEKGRLDEDEIFWRRVSQEAERIAGWVVVTMEIAGSAT